MCDFKVGDEVTKIDDAPWNNALQGAHRYGPAYGQVLRVVGIEIDDNRPWLVFAEFKGRRYNYTRFRKVQRRNIQEWLKQAVGNTDKLDKRQKVEASQ